MLGTFQCRIVQLALIIVGQGPTVLVVVADGSGLAIFFSRLSFLFVVSISLRDGSIWTEILSQRAV